MADSVRATRLPLRSNGLLAAAALTLLVYFALTAALPKLALAATAVLVLVAASGVTINLRYHSRALPLPKPAIIIHGILATIGFILLVMAVTVKH